MLGKMLLSDVKLFGLTTNNAAVVHSILLFICNQCSCHHMHVLLGLICYMLNVWFNIISSLCILHISPGDGRRWMCQTRCLNVLSLILVLRLPQLCHIAYNLQVPLREQPHRPTHHPLCAPRWRHHQHGWHCSLRGRGGDIHRTSE